MSDRNHLLDLPNDTGPRGDQQSLLFHSSPSSRSTIARRADGTPAEDGHPNDMAGQSQEPLRSDTPMSPSGLSTTVYSHHPTTSSLGVPRWNSNEMNQWPYRLFTTAPPTPSGGSTLGLGSFRAPTRQQDLEDLQNPLQLPLPPIDPTPQFVGQLSPTNLRIYDNCRGNLPSLWPTIAEEIYNLQARYGELIIFILGTEEDPRYRCGVCSHPTTTNPVHTKPKRRWDSSPDILSHGDHRIKPWFSNCGKTFPRHRDQRRHSAKCKSCNPSQQAGASPAQSSLASSPSFSPRLSLPPISPHNDAHQEPVIPRPPVNNHNLHPRGYPAPSPSNMFHTAPPLSYPYNQPSQPWDCQWAGQGVRYSHSQGPPARSYHEYHPYNGISHAQDVYVPAVYYNSGNQFPSYHPVDVGTGGRGMVSLGYPGHPNHTVFPPSIPILRETQPLGSNPSNAPPSAPAPSQYGAPGPRQDLWRQDGYGEKVGTSVNVSAQPAEKSCVDALEWRSKRINRSYRFTAFFLSLLILSVLFWFFVRYFFYP